MAQRTPTPGLEPDILIVGAGIAGLWAHAFLRAHGYDCLLIDREGAGGTQSLASQGIIHAGLKYALAGNVSTIAKRISKMPDIWRAALRGEGPVDLSSARASARSQWMLLPHGIGGQVMALAAHKALGQNTHILPREEWPAEITQTGFDGTAIVMDELVLDIPAVVRALHEAHAPSIRHMGGLGLPAFLARHNIRPRLTLYTAGEGNEALAHSQNTAERIEMRRRPLVMLMLRPAPFDFYAHLAGPSEKPVATITTHYTQGGERVWYIGGQVAEHPCETPLPRVMELARKAIQSYCPSVSLAGLHCAALPVDRAEGVGKGLQGWIPDSPVLVPAGNSLYAWPTKLTFAPLLAQRVLAHLQEQNFTPRGGALDYSALPPCPLTLPPWENAAWKNAA